KLKNIFSAFFGTTQQSGAASQGFSIETNDMHGKPKSVHVYGEPSDINKQGDLISSVIYKYNTEDMLVKDPTSNQTWVVGQQLNNKVSVLNELGEIEEREIGVESDLSVDLHEIFDEDYEIGLDYNTDGFVIPWLPTPIPVVTPIPLPHYVHNYNRLKRAVVTKVIQKYGILTETIATDQNSKVSTKNELFDGLTGDILMTSVQNEFDDIIYSTHIPAFRLTEYDGMGHAYKNIGAVAKVAPSGIHAGANPGYFTTDQNIFKEGDELMLEQDGIVKSKRWWVTEVTQSGSLYNVKIIDNTGGYAFGLPSGSSADSYFTIIRSGRKNLLKSNVYEQVQMTKPIIVSGGKTYIDFNSGNNRVINASSVTYKDNLAYYDQGGNPTNNIFLDGAKGIWRPHQSFVFMGERIQAANGSKNIRENGFLKDFASKVYFDFSNIYSTERKFKDHGLNYSKWASTGTLTKVMPDGKEVESKDALGIYSSEIYGYNNNLVVANAVNARFNENAFDGYEDYQLPYLRVQPWRHISVEQLNVTTGKAYDPLVTPFTDYDYSQNIVNSNGVQITNKDAHTGYYSVKIESSNDGMIPKLIYSMNTTAPSPSDNGNFATTSSDKLVGISPYKGGNYSISCWSKDGRPLAELNGLSGNNPDIKIVVKQ
ncbi:MAG: hypothetical protein HYZ42_09480, partial [Bacteroidetes bacterium]|nr:hypothetical protein [Bacteroidota bacterium]